MTAAASAPLLAAASFALAALVLAACLWLRLGAHHGGTARDESAPGAALRALAAGLLTGTATVLAGAGTALVLGSWTLAAPWDLLLRPQAVAAGCVAALLLFFYGGTIRRSWLLLGAGVAGALPWVIAPIAVQLDARLQLAAEPLSLAAAVLCGIVLSPGRRARLVTLARIAATRAAGDGILVVDGRGRILHANGAACAALNLTPGPPEAKGKPRLPQTVQKLLSEPQARRVRLKSGAGRFFEAWITEGSRTGLLRNIRALLLRDITGQYRDERRLVRLAHYDSLTGLANRRLFLENVKQALAAASTSDDRAALLYIDLDHFKELNDSLGHAAGDALLQALADRFHQYLRDENLSDLGLREGARIGIARLAGDEFAVIAPRVSDPEAAAELARRLLQLIATPIEIAGRSLTHSASVGIALFPDHAKDMETLIRHADAALYAAKSRGRNRYAFYEPSFDAKAERRRQIEQGLREAMQRGELRLHYQPKVDVVLSTVVGFEALLRWTSPELGVVGPGEFIPIAEERGLIGEIGAWCLDEACREIRSWADEGLVPIPVSVNVSSAQFRETEVQRVVSQALTRHEVDPQLLELELTESLLLEEGDHTALTLRDLRAIGVRIALDDFGTGYSALTYLNRFPLDVLKMDRDLLRDIDGNPAAAGIAAAVVSMAHSLGLCVVAEGVDSEGQLPVLRGMHCDQIQGFLYAAALPSEEARRLLAHQGERPPILQPGAEIPGRMATRSDAGGQDDELLPRPAGPGSPADPQECDDLPAPRANPLEAEDADLPRPRLVPTPGTGADVVSAPVDTAEGARRVLLLDDGNGSLGPLALRLGRLGLDVHYAGDPDEAQLFIAQERASIRLLVVPPTIDLRHASSARDALAREIGTPPPLIVIGEEPDVETRASLRSAGTTWILWVPFDDVELRFLMKSALALPRELFERREPRVPVDLVAKVQAGGRRDIAALSSLSARGAFVETPDPLPVGSQLRLEIELPTDRIRVFARVVHCQADDPDRLLSPTGGMGVVFFGPDRQTELALRKTVEERATRYLP